MSIDIGKEREWWETYDGDCAEDKAQLYLDELEDVNAKLEGKDRALRHAKEDLEKLRAQLADQRARDIRMMAFLLDPLGPKISSEDLKEVAAEYDRLAAIEVPPAKKEVERG